ncbi:MAG TPA: DNA-processing protein DprA [Patescibacteria group bacterium]|nr:DNA-processing protein DprA [Patescibacteria group bacterium]
MREKKFWVWLSSVPGVGSKSSLNLIRHFGSAENVYQCSYYELMASGLIREPLAKSITEHRNIGDIDEYLKIVKENGIKVYTIHDNEYPENLKNIYDPPPVLYVKGELIKEDSLAVGIVGSRKASDYGLKAAQRIASRLAELGITIVSGMALGIDSASHKGALMSKGRTIAVFGCGLKYVYPMTNYNLSKEILKSGALISEYPFDTEAYPAQFPARNRIISGMSLGVIVVEAGEKSGSLITADFALEQGREVFAVPGNISSPNSKGTNTLIKSGAKLVSNIEDIIEELNLNIIYSEKSNINNNVKLDISNEEGSVLAFLKEKGGSKDEIAAVTGLQPGKTMAALTKLEIKGLVQQIGGIYLLI